MRGTIIKENFRALLLALGFTQTGLLNRYHKQYPAQGTELIADFDAEKLVFPTAQGMTVTSATTTNFSAAENAVVFECVDRLFTQGYHPRQLELEPTWNVGHGGSGGRADVLVRDNDGQAVFIVECKTPGTEFDRAWRRMELDGGQPISYAQQEKSTKYVALYASWLDAASQQVRYDLHLVRTHDDEALLARLRQADPDHEPYTFAEAHNAREMYRAWDVTYGRESVPRGLFEPGAAPFEFGKAAYGLDDLRQVGHQEIEGTYHRFATILRKHNVAGRENAFDKLVNLLLCKIVDEDENPTALKFRWKGRAFDSDFDLQDRLQLLYKVGMGKMLNEEVTYITNEQIEQAFRYVVGQRDATKDTIKGYFEELKFYTNNAFAFIDVHNKKLFGLNAAVLRELVVLLQNMRLRTAEPNQFLGDLFEGFLDAGVKQSEGQFFTPLPVVRFLLHSLPLGTLLAGHPGPLAAIDYACGAGHFLNELALKVRALLAEAGRAADLPLADAGLVGIEKEYRLSKVAKVSAFMYGQPHTRIVHADALGQAADVADGTFQVLVANPPYSVKGFLETLTVRERERYELYTRKTVDAKKLGTVNSIEAFFIERAAQLLAPGGVAAIVLPSSIISNGGAVYVATRELLLEAFEVLAVVQLGSRTFGKTGTTTVTLFLRRRPTQPAPAAHYRHRVAAWFQAGPGDDEAGAVYQDEHLLLQYCRHQDWDPAHYRTLLRGQPSDELLAYELFQDYQKAFDKLTDTKKLRQRLATAETVAAVAEAAQQARRQKEAADLRADLARKWLDYLQAQEQDKLYYFVLAAAGPAPGQAPRPVVLIKSPADNAEQKQFLGYDWSGAKGNEGIQYLTADRPAPKPKKEKATADAPEGAEAAEPETDALENLSKLTRIQTTLYDPQNRTNPAKLNTYIERNFRGEDIVVPDELAPYLSTARLVDMLDFSRVDFDKKFSLSPRKRATIESVWPTQKLSALVKVLGGGTPDTKRPDYWNGGIPWLSVVDFNNESRYVSTSEKTISEAGLENSSTRYLEVGDLILSARGTVGALAELAVRATFNQSCYGLRPNLDLVSAGYIYYTLREEIAQLKANAGGSKFDAITTATLDDIVIPVPPPAVQAALVAACEAVDTDVAQATAALGETWEQVEEAVQAVYDAGYPQQKLLAVADTNPSKSALREVPDDTLVSFVDMPAVSNDGFIERATPRPLAELRKGSYTYFAENDIILAKITPCLENGKCALATGLTNGLALGSTEFHVVRAHAAQVLPAYLFALLNREAIRVEAERHMTGASGHRRAPITFYENLSLPVPDLTAQQALIATLAALDATAAAAQATIAAAPARKQALVRQYLQAPPAAGAGA